MRHNRSFETLPGATGTPVTLVGHPVRYDGVVPGTRLPPQRLGAQSADILREIGYGDDEVAALREAKVVGFAPD